MKRLALALVAITALSAPAMTQTMAVILPTLTFPDDTVVPSTKGCGDKAAASVCQIEE